MIDRTKLELLIAEGNSIQQIADHLEVSMNTVKRRMKKWGVKTLKAKCRETFNYDKLDPIDIEQMIRAGVTFREIARKQGCSFGKIRHFIKNNNLKIERQCNVCGMLLTGNQTRFCSTKCHSKWYSQMDNKTYHCQKIRGEKRKDQLIEMSGGKCIRCGYNRCRGALEFHHRDPKQKLFRLDVRSLSNRKWDKIETEFTKCDLLCSNCHREEHLGITKK